MNRRRRVAMLVENVKDSGGNRVLFLKAAELAKSGGNHLTIYVTARRIARMKDVAGQARDIIASKIKYHFADAVELLWGNVDFSRFDEVITTGRRALDFIDQLDDPRHLHLIQHIEAWGTLNSAMFREFAESVRYPTGLDCLALIRRNAVPAELAYLDRLAHVTRFATVSNFLKSILESFASTKEVTLRPPPDVGAVPPIVTNRWASPSRDIDILYFMRGLPFKGDALIADVINGLAKEGYRGVLIAGLRNRKMVDAIADKSRLRIINNIAPNHVVADLYSRARIVVHPSLSEGYGLIPREALRFGCHVIASRTGELQDVTEAIDRLTIIDRHLVELYVSEIRRVLQGVAPPQTTSPVRVG